MKKTSLLLFAPLLVLLTQVPAGAAITWDEYDPIGVATSTSFMDFNLTPGGPYQLSSPQTPNAALGPARGGIFDAASVGTTDFSLSVDIVAFDDAIIQAYGIIARADNFGIGQLTGYALNITNTGQLELNRIDNEAPVQIGYAFYGNIEPQYQYRIVFTGAGDYFTGQLFNISLDPLVPVASLDATDATYAAGQSGLFVLASDDDIGTDVTFDNFHVIPEPSLYAGAFGLLTLLTVFALRRQRSPQTAG